MAIRCKTLSVCVLQNIWFVVIILPKTWPLFSHHQAVRCHHNQHLLQTGGEALLEISEIQWRTQFITIKNNLYLLLQLLSSNCRNTNSQTLPIFRPSLWNTLMVRCGAMVGHKCVFAKNLMRTLLFLWKFFHDYISVFSFRLTLLVCGTGVETVERDSLLNTSVFGSAK